MPFQYRPFLGGLFALFICLAHGKGSLESSVWAGNPGLY